MVTIQRSKLNETVVEAIRDILRNNLTTPSGKTGNWVFKDNPETDFKQSDYPVVIIDEASIDFTTLGLRGSRYQTQEINLNINIYSLDTYQRDVIADEIRTILLDTTSEDADEDTLWDFRLRVKSIRSGSRDMFIDQAKMVRVKEIQLTMRYFGG